MCTLTTEAMFDHAGAIAKNHLMGPAGMPSHFASQLPPHSLAQQHAIPPPPLRSNLNLNQAGPGNGGPPNHHGMEPPPFMMGDDGRPLPPPPPHSNLMHHHMMPGRKTVIITVLLESFIFLRFILFKKYLDHISKDFA